MKEFLKLFISLTVIITLGAYAFFLYTLPIIANSVEYVLKYEDFLSQKISASVVMDKFELKTHPDLSFDIYLHGIYIVPKNRISSFHADNLKYSGNLFNLKDGKFSADYIYANLEELNKNIKFEKSSKSKKFNPEFLPQINIKKAYIKLNNNNYSEIGYIYSTKKNGRIITKLFAKLYNPYTKNPVLLGNTGTINFKKKISFDNFSIKIDNSQLSITGDNSRLNVKGNNLPITEFVRSFLYFYKLKYSNKRNFIENFSDFKGEMDVNLVLDKKGIHGNCTTHNLGANFSNFKIPVFLPETVFNFNGKEIYAKTNGTFGGEPVTTDFSLTGLLTKDLNVFGSVSAPLTNKIAKKYYPQVKIAGYTNANVKYHTHNEKVDVFYSLIIDRGSNILTKWGNLDNTDKKRIISMHTVKQGIPMKIESWDYTINDNDKILSGDGLFKKVNGHYTLSDLSIKTNGKISVNYIKSFLLDYIQNGTFDANLKLDFLLKVISGEVNLYDVSHDKFLYLKNARMTVDKDNIKFFTEGSFFNSQVKISADLANHFSENLLIHNIDIHLNEFFLKKGKMPDISKSFKKNEPKFKTSDKGKRKIKYTVEHGKITADRIYGNKFDVRNVHIQGSLKNDVASFIIPKADYANGLLSAKGIYNLANHAADINFFASDIDSNIVLTQFFKLPNHVHGEAFATLHVITKNKLNDIKATATFAINDGYMPHVENQEFYIGKKKNGSKKRKIKLSKVINIDFSKKENISTNIYGSFNLDNDVVRNLKMFAKSEWVGLYFEGDYDIYSQEVNMKIYGQRNITHAKGIKLFKIPVNLIYKLAFRTERSVEQYKDKIKLIPAINKSIVDDIAVFRVSILGFLGKKNGLKLEMKNLR